MVIRRCPLCWINPETGVVEHLRSDHRRSEIEACTLLERAYGGALGWDAEGSVLRSTARPRWSTPCSSKVCFAISRPILVIFILDPPAVLVFDGHDHHHWL